MALVALFAPPLFSLLTANDPGDPQDLANATAESVCANRLSLCNVLLDVPRPCAGATSTCPLLLCLHGFGGSNKGYVFECGMHVHGRGHWIGIYPQGDPLGVRLEDGSKVPGWNDGQAVDPAHTLLRCPYDDFSCQLDPNDGVFFERIIGALRATGAQGRIFVFGQSNGADFAQRLAVNAGPKLPVAGIAAESSQLDAKPSRSAAGPFNLNQPHAGGLAVAVLSIHGTADMTISYDGGSKFGSKVFVMFSEPESNRVWAKHNGCTGELQASNTSLVYHGGTGVATHWVWRGCPTEVPVEYYQSHGAGHVGTVALGGTPLVAVVLDYFERVGRGLDGARIVVEDDPW